MTSSGPKAQGKGIKRPGLTGSLLRRHVAVAIDLNSLGQTSSVISSGGRRHIRVERRKQKAQNIRDKYLNED